MKIEDGKTMSSNVTPESLTNRKRGAEGSGKRKEETPIVISIIEPLFSIIVKL